MNFKLTFKPSLFDWVRLLFAWVESYLRIYYIQIFLSPTTRFLFTNAFQVRTRQLFDQVCKIWKINNKQLLSIGAYGVRPEIEACFQEVLTAPLMFLHARLLLEKFHYRNQDEISRQKNAKINQKINCLMPTWERLSKLKRMPYLYSDKSGRTISKGISDLGDSWFRLLSGYFLITLFGSMVFYILTHMDNSIYWVANKLSMSSLPFPQSYAIFITVMVILSMFTILVPLEVFHEPSNSNIQDYLSEQLDDIDTRLADVCNTLDNELVPRLGNFETPMNSLVED
jgi:hypothetical protein